jgi:hypothetical protein
VPLDQLEPVKPKAKPYSGPAASANSFTVPLEELEPAPSKLKAPAFPSAGPPTIPGAAIRAPKAFEGMGARAEAKPPPSLSDRFIRPFTAAAETAGRPFTPREEEEEQSAELGAMSGAPFLTRRQLGTQFVKPEAALTTEEQKAHPIATGALEFTGGLATPENVFIAQAMGGAPSLIAKLAGLGFSTSMLYGAYNQIPDFKAAWDRKDWGEVKRLATHLALGATFAGLASRVGFGEKPPAEATGEKATEERAAVQSQPGVPATPAAPGTPSVPREEFVRPAEPSRAAGKGAPPLAEPAAEMSPEELADIRKQVGKPEMSVEDAHLYRVQKANFEGADKPSGEDLTAMPRAWAKLEVAQPSATPTVPGALTVPIEELKPVRPKRGRVPTPQPVDSADVLRRAVADESLPQPLRDAASAELQRLTTSRAAGAGPAPKLEVTPPEQRTLERVEASPYQRQQAQLYVNRIKDLYTREYAQSYLKANLEGTIENDRGNVSPFTAAAIRRSIDDNLAKQARVPVAEKYPADVLEEAQSELRAAHDLASSFDRPGRYHPDLGPDVGIKEQDKTWYGVTSSRKMVGDQFPWYAEQLDEAGFSKENITPGQLTDAVTRGKGANYERIVDRIADHIQAQREEAAPILEEYGPQLETLAAQVRDVDPELAQTLTDIRSGRYSSLKDLPGFIERKVSDATKAAQFSHAFDELSDAEAGDALPEGAPQGVGLDRGARETGLGEEAPHGQLAPLEVPLSELTPQPALPGMAGAVEEQRQAAGREQGRRLTEQVNRPPESIEETAGRMERESPLFRGTEASPQREIFGNRMMAAVKAATEEPTARPLTKSGTSAMMRGAREAMGGVPEPQPTARPLSDRAKATRAAKGPSITELIKEAYTPGNVVKSYYGRDKVLEFTPGDPTVQGKPWQVKVIASDEKGNPLPGEEPRVHSTMPERVDMAAARKRLEEKRAGPGTLYGGLGFLDPALIRRVMPENIKNALGENISIGEREAGIVREKTGELARKKEQVFQQYANAMARWEKRPVEEGRDFILREQHGERQPNADDQAVADQLQKEFAARRQAVEDLSHGSFDHWKEHYFPQLWERPTKIADWVVKQIMGGKRPLQGPAGFRKARVFDDLQEGLDAGFEPVTNNPVSMALLKLHEMDRYTMAHEILGTMKEEGLAKAVMVGDHAPEGWTRISDGISTIYGDRRIPIKEYYDEAVLSKLSDTARNLGIEHERAVGIGGSRLGYTTEGSNRIVTRFATPEAVIAHEIGHQLDWKYGLKDQLVKDPRYKLELRKLVDLKFEGREREDVPASFRTKIRRGEEKMATIVEALVQAPDKFREVAPNTWAFLQKLIANNPELKPLLEAKPSLVYGQRQDTVSAGGMVIRGYYYAPAEAARVLNNHLAPGLRGNPLYDTFRGVGNTLNQAQLGFSAFHAMFSAVNSSISDLALAFRKGSTLRMMEAAMAAARVVPLVVSPIRHVVIGTRLMREYLSPGSYAEYSRLADAVATGGGRIYQDPFYRNSSLTQFWKAWGEGDWAHVGLKAFPAALEYMAKPVMEKLVPRLKLGAFSDVARESLDRLPPEAGKAQIRAALDRAWDSIDNRFGQVVYDNLFVNKTLKDLGLAGVRSLGWNLGTVREIGGAAKDTGIAMGRTVIGEKPQLTDRMAYTIALPIVAGYIGALVNYAYTGKGPQELKDYYFPRTGRTLPNGEPERISVPTYMKDVFAFSKHPLETAGHKVHPLMGMIADMLRNKDFYGVEIRHADDPLVKQVGQIAGYVASQVSPLSVRNLRQRAQAEGRPGVKGMLREAVSPAGVQSFFGITPAPASVTHTAAEEKALEILDRRRPKGTRTSEEYEHQARRSYLRGEVASGRMTPRDLAARVQAGEIRPKEAGDILRQTREAPIVHFTRNLDLHDFLSVWDVANAREQGQLRSLLISKSHLIANLPASERAAMSARLKAAIAGQKTAGGTIPRSFSEGVMRGLKGQNQQ